MNPVNPVDALDSGKCAGISPLGEKEKPGLGVFFAFLLSFNLRERGGVADEYVAEARIWAQLSSWLLPHR